MHRRDLITTWDRKNLKARIKKTIKGIPILGKFLSWGYSVLKMPIILKRVTGMDSVLNKLANLSANRLSCYLGNNIAITKVRGFKMLVNTKDIGITPHLIIDGFWEMHITPLFESIIEEGFVVVDIGANIGYYTLLAARKVGKQGKVYSFEPEAKSFDILCKNIEINGFRQTVTACQKALLDREDKIDFNVYEENIGSSSIFVDNSIFVGHPHKKKIISIQATTLDAFLGDNVGVDLIKMDAEGAEPFIFEGMKNVIKNSPVLKIIMEFAPSHIEAAGKNSKVFLQTLTNMGFTIKLIDRNSGQLNEVDIDSLLKCEIEDLFLEKVNVSLSELMQVQTTNIKGSIMNEELKNEMNSIKWWHRIELEDGLFTPGEVVHGADGSDYATTRFGMPKDLSGKTVLDVGAWDGFFSFEAEKRGASKVVACDVSMDAGGNWSGTTGFNFAKKVLKSNVEFKECSIEDLISNNIGTYDIVMCYGVLYHLQNLIPALKNLAAVTKEYALIETAVLPAVMDTNPTFPLCAFLNGFNNDPSNYWYPNTQCLVAMLQFCGFKRIELVGKCGDIRVTIKAYK